MKKRLLSFFLSCLLLAALLPASYAAEEPLISPAPTSELASKLPVLDIIGSLDGLTSKEDKVTVEIDYSSEDLSFSSSATLKWQGSSSLAYPKKNFTVNFLKEDGKKNKICLVDDWGKQSKYCLKANWVDPSQARNVVSGRIYNQIIHSREIDDELAALPNGGVVDGFPVIINLNGEFLGLYTLNIPKDKWMFGMDDEGHQALLFGDSWSVSSTLYREIADPENPEASGWELEYCSTEDSEEGTAWAAESMNEFIRFLKKNNGKAFREGIGEYTDLDRAMDVFLFTFFIHGKDNLAKNIIWATYDGIKWIPSPYDMDATWGAAWNGEIPFSYSPLEPFGSTLLFSRLLENYPDEIRSRYVELRSGPLSLSNIQEQFLAFRDSIPEEITAAEADLWKDVPHRDRNSIEQILSFVQERAILMDSFFGTEISEELALLPSSSAISLGKSAVFRTLANNTKAGDSLRWEVCGTKKYEISPDGMTCTIKARKPGTIRVTVSLCSADGIVRAFSSADLDVTLLPLDIKFNRKTANIKATVKALFSFASGF